MQHCLPLTFAMVAFAATAFAEEPVERPPASLLGFLKSGLHVGIKSDAGNNSVNLLIFDDDEHAVALDVARSRGEFVDAESLSTKHKIVRRRLDSHLAKLRGEIGDAKNAIRVYPLRGMFIGTVRSVGDDYVVMEYVRVNKNDEVKVKVVINKLAIARIYLDADPITFTSP